MTKKTAVDIEQFDAIKIESVGQPLELMFKGSPTGITLKVLGSNSDEVRAFTDAKLIEYAKQAHHARTKGADAELNYTIKSLTERDKNSIESALVRVNGWEGASYKGSEAFTKDGLRFLLERNPAWVREVIEFSEDLGK